MLYNSHNLTLIICLQSICSVWPKDWTLPTPSHSGTGSNGNEWVRYIPQISRAEGSLSVGLVPYLGHSLGGVWPRSRDEVGVFYNPSRLGITKVVWLTNGKRPSINVSRTLQMKTLKWDLPSLIKAGASNRQFTNYISVPCSRTIFVTNIFLKFVKFLPSPDHPSLQRTVDYPKIFQSLSHQDQKLKRRNNPIMYKRMSFGSFKNNVTYKLLASKLYIYIYIYMCVCVCVYRLDWIP